ncbi:hypothetical protein PUR71_03890 [Streptomyces sp. SP17BM10]|uniref:hypothetical protein n=1 Tax=Streptomyces sp. SP17BM10 TaxID=3002530 RepID=UPI002E75ED21|nr:hypothetical protein [Streptomyces sp. SP17BM10]MEE1782077.1 hypothetical protein [Streptomyces sp. SP17BM10]
MPRWLRAVLLLGGLALLGFGLSGLLADSYITDPLDVLVWAVGAVVLHDGLWLPLLCLVGARYARGPVLRAWLVVAAAVTAVGLPAVLRDGTNHGNPSVLPLPYGRNLLLVLTATAAVALLVALVRRWRTQGLSLRRRRPADPS